MQQETTMAKHRTLPEYLYQSHLEVGDKVNLNFEVDKDEGPYEDLNEHEVSEEPSVSSEGQQEFDESSDAEVEVFLRTSKVFLSTQGLSFVLI